MSRTGLLTALVLGIMVLLSGAAFAQDAGGGGGAGGAGGGAGGRGGRGGAGGGGGGFDPAAMRERMLQQYKERLGANDEEWKVLQPRIEKVMTAQRDARSGGFGFGGGRGGRGGDAAGGGGGAAPADQSAVAKASTDLRSALESNAGADEIKSRLTALREARAKAREDLTKAQKELQEVVTAKQEAQLVVSGLLE